LSVWYVDLEGGQWLATVPYALIEAAEQAAESARQAQQACDMLGVVLAQVQELLKDK
jgi:hypothetical protein